MRACRRRKASPRQAHLKGDVDLAYVAAGYAVLDDVHLDASFEQVERGLEHADVRFDAKDDDVLDVACALEPCVRDAGEVHAELGLWVDGFGRQFGQLLDEVAQGSHCSAEGCEERRRSVSCGFVLYGGGGETHPLDSALW